MKRMIGLLMLVTGITETAIAQNEFIKRPAEKIFDIEPDYFKRKFLVDLGKGNHLQVETVEMEDLEQITNVDSLLRIYLQDITLFKDSLSNELATRRIDYVLDAGGKNKVRIRSYAPDGSSFLVQKGNMASLKLAQDTVFITGEVPYNTNAGKSGSFIVHRFYRIGLFVNQLNNIQDYTDGRLNEKMTTIRKSEHARWVSAAWPEERWQIRKGDKSISAAQPAGYSSGLGDYLRINAGLNLQNYKNYFTPSFNISAAIVVNAKKVKYDIGLAWEPHFIFAKNSLGNLQTYRNDFITLTAGFDPKTEKARNHNEAHFDFFRHFSFGYLVTRKGDFFEPNTFRFGTGGIDWLNGKIKLEPVLYFHNFLKGATPGLRLSVNF